MRVDSVSAAFSISVLKQKAEIKVDKITIKDKEVIFKMNIKVEVSFSFVKRIVREDNKIDDDLLEVLKQMAVELSKLAIKKGRKRISLTFYDQKTALKIASFENGKFLKDYISLIKIIELTHDILYKDDKSVEHYEIVPKVTDYLIKQKKVNYILKKGKFTFNFDFVKRAYSSEIIA